MTTLIEAAQQALKALEGGGDSWVLIGPAIDALRAALAQEEQPFLVTRCQFFGDPPAPHQSWHAFFDHAVQTRTFADVCISASPRREWKGLSEEEIYSHWHGTDWRESVFVRLPAFASAIEQALKEKNHG